MQPKQFGIVRFDSQPHGAYIYVDGQILVDPDTEEALRTPARTLLYEGRRDFTFTLEGHEDASGYVDVLPGVTVNIFRNLKVGKSEGGWGEPQPQIYLDEQSMLSHKKTSEYPQVPDDIYQYPQYHYEDIHQYPQRPYLGSIVTNTRPANVDVYLDGQPVLDSSGQIAKTPSVLSGIAEGVHMVTFRKEGYNDTTIHVDVAEKSYSDAYAILNPSQMMRYPKMLSASYQDLSYQDLRENEVRTMKSIKPLGIEELQQPIFEVAGDVVITSYPSGAKIYMDGRLVIDADTKEPILTPTVLAMYMGLHNLKFTMPGYCDKYDVIYVSPGGTQYLNETLNIC
jgi:hypothetical protein